VRLAVSGRWRDRTSALHRPPDAARDGTSVGVPESAGEERRRIAVINLILGLKLEKPEKADLAAFLRQL
jgi:hypothetical protein